MGRGNFIRAHRHIFGGLTAMAGNVGSCVLVTGTPFSTKDTLKAIGGGSWCKPLQGWVFPEEKRAEVVAALSKIGPVTQGVAAMPKAEPFEPSKGANATLTIEPYKKAILVKGDTKIVKDQLQALGAKWNKSLGGWIFQASRKDEVMEQLRRDSTNTVEEVEGSSEPQYK